MIKRSENGFSMVELLVVVAIIALLAALSFPVFSRAKRAARVTESKSNLRQVYLVMALYAADHEDRLPDYGSAKNLALKAPLTSPLDDWKTPPAERTTPMIGSFGYGFAVADELTKGRSEMSTPSPLLADIFVANYRVTEFEGSLMPSYDGCGIYKNCEFPEVVWFAYTDGSLRRQRNPVPPPLGTPMAPHRLFSWPELFDRELSRSK